jgi:hypothetical protein
MVWKYAQENYLPLKITNINGSFTAKVANTAGSLVNSLTMLRLIIIQNHELGMANKFVKGMDCRKYVNQIAISEDEFYGYLF